jgi:hypothetical protein
MATIKTVKPLGGGDFSSLQAWWNWAKTQVNPDQWAECYGGGNLGFLDATGGHAFTPDASNYPRIYAAAGHRHNLKWDTSKAYIDGGHNCGTVINAPVNYLRIEGLQIKATGESGMIVAYTGATAGPYYYKDLLLIGGSGAGTNLVYGIYSYVRNDERDGYLENCMFVDCGYGGFFGTAVGADWYVLDCGFKDCGNTTGNGSIFNIVADVDHRIFVKNCYALNTGGAPNFHHAYYAGTFDFASTFSSDGSISANGYTQTNCVQNVDTAGQLADYNADWKTLGTSDFVGAGVDLSAVFTTDAVGNLRAVPWWVGPYQSPASTFKPAWAANSTMVLGSR